MAEQEIHEECGRPILSPLTKSPTIVNPFNLAYFYVKHAYFGCDTGCCGHRVFYVDKDGREYGNDFEFDHYDCDNAIGEEEWARSLQSRDKARLNLHYRSDLSDIVSYESCNW